MSEFRKTKNDGLQTSYVGSCCTAVGAFEDLFNGLADNFKVGLGKGEWRVKCINSGCFTSCKSSPMMCLQPDSIWHYKVTKAHLDRIINVPLAGKSVRKID